MGKRVKAEIDANTEKANKKAVESLTQQEPRSQQLQQLEERLTAQLEGTTDPAELVRLLQSNADDIADATSHVIGRCDVPMKTLRFTGK